MNIIYVLMDDHDACQMFHQKVCILPFSGYPSTMFTARTIAWIVGLLVRSFFTFCTAEL
jgi:hypothetical protein